MLIYENYTLSRPKHDLVIVKLEIKHISYQESGTTLSHNITPFKLSLSPKSTKEKFILDPTQ